MTEPKDFFKVLTEIPHVRGAFAYDLEGQLIYSDVEGITRLQKDILGRRLRALREAMWGKLESLNGFFFKFGDCKIFLRMTSECFIGVFADKDADQRTIQIASNVLVKVFDLDALREAMGETKARGGKFKLTDTRAVKTIKLSSSPTSLRINRPAPAPVVTSEPPLATEEGDEEIEEVQRETQVEEDSENKPLLKALKLFRRKKDEE